MGFKLPGKSMHSGTSSHGSALKMKKESMAKMAKKDSMAKMAKNSPMDKALVGNQNNLPEDLKAKIEASPAKSKEYDAAAKKDPNLGSYVAERKKIKAKYGGDRKKYRASEEYKANQSKINKAYGIDDGYVAPTTTSEVKEEKQPRVVKEKNVEKDKSKTVYRKDGTVKKEVNKTVNEDSDGRVVEKDKTTYRKDGSKKKYVTKEKDSGYNMDGKYRYKTKTKYDKEGDVKKSKTVQFVKGRRFVDKTDAEGNTTRKSRRTIKGFLTGKGKKSDMLPGDRDKYTS
tara:strand:+ start:2586 stop:3440 length:855 start_codon:yes stop_codon:yes gene_type:complete